MVVWYLCIRQSVRPREEWTATLDDHYAWMKQQHQAGKILFSGPTPDHQQGIYVINAGSREEAERIAASDPFTACGGCTYQLWDWELHEIMGVGRFERAPAGS